MDEPRAPAPARKKPQMTKSGPGSPDPDSQDPGANQDEALWLDLVARLEATDSGEPAKTFRDFDPLGLAAAPVRDAAPGPRDYEPEDDDGFVPEDPPSLAGSDPMTVLAWLGAVGGPIALLLTAMFWRSAPLLAVMGMVAVFAASVVFLIMKLPHEKDEYDDGARV